MRTDGPTTIEPQGLGSRSFLGLLATQFLGALNDNAFRWLAVPIAKQSIDDAVALSLGLACFTVPYLLLAMPAGYLADRFSKRTVIVGCKIAEIALMVLGVGAILLGSVAALFAVVGLMGAQSALFSPSKFGSIPEMLPERKLSIGNGWMGLATVVASAGGFLAGNALYSPEMSLPGGGSALAIAATTLIGIAVAGWLTSLLIARLPAANPERKPERNLIVATGHNLKLLASDIPLFRTSLGIAFFWMLASLVQVNIDAYGIDVLALEQAEIGILGAVLVAGVGLGSVLAGLWSGGKVELGIVPLGGMGIAVCSLLLFAAGDRVEEGVAVSLYGAFVWSCVWLFLLGISAGLFNVPLEAYLQHRTEVQTRGTILAASNFIAFSFILLASGLFLFMQNVIGLSASEIFLVAGLCTIPVAAYVFSLIPDATIRFGVWLLSHTVYRVRVRGRENLPEHGGALLVANHVSWIDGILLLITSSRPIRMIAYADYVENPKVRWLARMFRVIPIKADGGPKALVQSLKTAREALIAGDLVCIFAEGSLTRTGQLQPFQGGMLRIVSGTGAPVIPVYLDELWGSIFSYRGGRFFWKLPRRWPFPVSISFGPPLAEPRNAEEVRQAVQQMGVEAMEQRKERELVLPRRFLRVCREKLLRTKMADSSGQEFTGGKLLAAVLAFRRALLREVIAADERWVGVLLPPANGSAITNLALTLAGRVAVNLNYTLTEEDVNYCIREAGLKHVLTSRRFLEQRPFKLDAEVICLEDLKDKVTKADRALAALGAFATPVAVLERSLGLHRIGPDDLLTIIFTSGSTGEPKGVMLSHHNVLSNVEAVDHLFHLTADDVLLGVLPFFHSFGYTATLWLPLALKPSVVYHFNPLDARQVGKLCEKHGVSIVMATPTFLRSYLKRCEKQQMHRLDLLITGAEKLPADLAQSFEEKFGVAPTEGYGTTELSPLAAVNVPDHRGGNVVQKGTKMGTVGRAVPGVAAKTVDAETRDDLGVGDEGLLFIKGPNVMLGYLNRADKTAEVIQDGWYNTGDMAKIDAEGFIEITGRMSRFSKIGGEMVPHIRIEELLMRIVEDETSEDTTPRVAVTSAPDERKGERLVVLYRGLSKPLDQVKKELEASGIPNLWIPDSYLEVEEIPILGSGKLDLKRVQQVARDRLEGTIIAPS